MAVDDWNVYTNVNSNGNPEWGGGGICEDGTCAQARYPSAVASEDYPYAIWNEYTAAESTYGVDLIILMMNLVGMVIRTLIL